MIKITLPQRHNEAEIIGKTVACVGYGAPPEGVRNNPGKYWIFQKDRG